MSERKITSTLLIVFLCLVAVLVSRHVKEVRAARWVEGQVAESRVKGSPRADIQIVEHIDYQCGACRDASFLLGDYQRKYPDRFQIAVRFHPLDGHRHGLTSALWAECAEQQKKFWPYHDLLFKRQASWSKLDDPKPAFLAMAQELNLDQKQLQDCVRMSETIDRVKKEKAIGKSKGVVSTPTFFVNGKMIVGSIGLRKELEALFPHEQKKASPS